MNPRISNPRKTISKPNIQSRIKDPQSQDQGSPILGSRILNPAGKSHYYRILIKNEKEDLIPLLQSSTRIVRKPSSKAWNAVEAGRRVKLRIRLNNMEVVKMKFIIDNAKQMQIFELYTNHVHCSNGEKDFERPGYLLISIP